MCIRDRTISGLACGKPIRGHVAFLGGPLHFLDQLKAAFIRTLKLDDEHAITPENSHLFAAMGSAMNAKYEVTVSLTDMTNRLKNSIKLDFEVERMEPLFATEEDYEAFNKRQSAYQVKKGDLSQYHGNCYLGIDACLLYTSRWQFRLPGWLHLGRKLPDTLRPFLSHGRNRLPRGKLPAHGK